MDFFNEPESVIYLAGGYCHIPKEEIWLFSNVFSDPSDYQRSADDVIREKLTKGQFRVNQESKKEAPFEAA